MNKNEKQNQLPVVFSNTNGSNIEIHPHVMIAVTTVVVLQHNESSSISQRLICEAECSNERFEIIVLKETAISGIQFKFKFIREAVEQLIGWSVHLFKMCSPASSNDRIIVDRQMKQLYIDADILRMPLRALIKLIGRLPELLAALTGRLKMAVEEFGKLNDSKTLRVNQQASVALSVGESGLYFPSHYVFSANELFVHVSINENEIYLRFDNGWRMFYQSNVLLPFYAYKTPIEVIERGYTIPFPVEVCHELKCVTKEVHFEVHAD